MAAIRQISGSTTDDIWQQVSVDLSGQEIYEYNVCLVQDGRKVELAIDIDLGGGFESGYAFTSFKALVAPEHDFRFALHHQDLIDATGKFFGMEDVVIGYPEFDEALIIKTNDRERTRRIFSDVNVREIFQSLRLFALHLTHHHIAGQKEKAPFLELTIEEGITDPAVLRKLYDAFYRVLRGVEVGWGSDVRGGPRSLDRNWTWISVFLHHEHSSLERRHEAQEKKSVIGFQGQSSSGSPERGSDTGGVGGTV